MSWPGALERVVEEVVREAARRGILTGGLASGGITASGVATAARPWLDLAAAAGPTPAEGPLLHDVLLPGGGAFGLIAFGHREEHDVVGVAQQWAGTFLGPAAATAIAKVRRAPGKGSVLWSAGFRVGPGGLRLKLYASARPGAVALKQIGRAVGLSSVGAASSIGVDAGRAGLERARTYLTLPGARSAGAATVAALRGLEAWWTGAGDWLEMSAPAGASHRLLASLGRRSTRGGKRALVHIFGPSAPLDGLVDVDEAVGELAGTGCLNGAWLRSLAAVAGGAGLTLRPVAHELDLHADGRRSADAFVTVAAPARA